MKLFITIASAEYAAKLDHLYAKSGINFRFQMPGFGTAENELLELLGLGENRKIIMLGAAQHSTVHDTYKRLERELRLTRAGTGIAFTVPMSAASKAVTKLTPSVNIKERGVKDMPEATHELIVTIINRGSYEIANKAAKSAGARGGTLIHGLGVSGKEAAKFLGIEIMPEKDIMLSVVKQDKAADIMNAILQAAGLSTEGNGILFSLPVDSVMGLTSWVDDSEVNAVVED
ncbi:MAG: hypothetical protein LBM98_06870 [Oscillospiraceae bacterium]|jgi:nitrogen regulatory protein PII|nr:hypothetical protein [Oscillospiraceae bacterium]